MMLNLIKTKALVDSRSRIVSPPHGDLVLSGVSIRAGSNFDILGLKFHSKLAPDDDVRGIISIVSLIEFVFSLSIVFWCGGC